MLTVEQITKRRLARQLLVQCLYAKEISGMSLQSQFEQILPIYASLEENNQKIPAYDEDYVKEALLALEDCSAMDILLEPALSRPLSTIDLVEKSILRISAWEMKERLEIPERVVINEGIELAKSLGAESSFRFVNGVLHKLSKSLRFSV